MMVVFDDFWSNVSRYPRYFLTIILGIFFFAFDWLKPLFKNPVTAVALVAFMVSGLIFIVLTLRAMLGLTPV
ncbi:DUF751 family protein [Kamptonema formosum]|jgi:hypothetical protein|uniref:DUF751 family protein n=1 Tax=Kamptonema formosum TaxID=331992 RepID=UPI00037F3086|nr:DUF751 family protein [Oscillatoria sp. PCC 10802]